MKIQRIVLDTNIFVSDLICGGKARECIDKIRNKKIQIFVSEPMLLELEHVMYEKFSGMEGESESSGSDVLQFAEVVEVSENIKMYTDDPADNIVLQTAINSAADFLVTGDKALLALKKIRNTKIISLREILEILEK